MFVADLGNGETRKFEKLAWARNYVRTKLFERFGYYEGTSHHGEPGIITKYRVVGKFGGMVTVARIRKVG